MSPIVLISFAAVALFALLAVVYFRLVLPGGRFAADVDWWEQFSPERYLAMPRLLAGDDLQFLRAQPGYDADIERQLRRIRLRTFKRFLSEIRLDFARLHAVGQAMVLAGAAGPAMQDQLFLQKLRFTRGYWRVRCELFAWRFGVGEVDVTPLVESLERLALTFRPVALNAA